MIFTISTKQQNRNQLEGSIFLKILCLKPFMDAPKLTVERHRGQNLKVVTVMPDNKTSLTSNVKTSN